MSDTLAPKAPYVTPRLVVYGDLRSITQNMGNMGEDGGSSPHTFSM